MIKLRKWRIPVELFKIVGKYYAFDANRVYFIQIDEIVYQILSITKYVEKNKEDLIKSLKNKYET